MEIATVRNGLIAQMQADADLIAEVPAADIDYGLGKSIGVSLLPRSIRVVQLGRGVEILSEYAAGVQWFWVPYRFHVVTIFGLSTGETEKDAEDIESTLDRLVLKAIGQDFTIGGIAAKSYFGRTVPLVHPEKDDIRMLVTEVDVLCHERSDTR